MMNYRQSLDYIFSQLPMFHRIGAPAYKPDLGNITGLCRSLGNPQDQFMTVHVAGTNGKGSVSHMLASICMEAGMRTGLFTSPHLKDFRERIRINGKMIPKKNVARFISDHREEFGHIHPSFFEMSAALAFDHFRNEKVDIAIIETGLGGRLDSTNIITPVLAVITNISFDHMMFLGETLAKIAWEKAGIIKPSVPVVIGETQPAIRHVFLNKAHEMKAPLIFADEVFTVVRPGHSGSKDEFLHIGLIDTATEEHFKIASPLAGNYQVKNLVTVMGALKMLRLSGHPVPGEAVRKGIRNVIKNTGLNGRWQVIGKEPLTICDTGHNEGGIREVVAQIAATPHKRLHFVFGAVSDKDLAGILHLLPKDAVYYFCRPNVPRGLNEAELAMQAFEAGLHGEPYPSVQEAFKVARVAANPDDLVFVGGSTFVVAEVL